MKLSHNVLSRVAGLELDKKFKCSLIRLLFKASSHLFPVVLKDIGTSTTRLLAEATIRLGPNCDAARTDCLAPDTDPSGKRFILLAHKSTWKLDAELIEELHSVDVREFL